MSRFVACATACALFLCVPSPAWADTVVISSGTASLYRDGSLTGLTIASADSQFVSEYHSTPNTKTNPDGSFDFSTSIPISNAANHPLSETYRGQTFQAWVTGSLTIVAKPVVPPPPGPEGSFQTFTTTFTMTGSITGYGTSDHAGTPLFSTNVMGGGTYQTGPYRVVSGSYVPTSSSADALRFDAPAAVNAPPPFPWVATDVGAVGRSGGSYAGPSNALT